MHINKPMASALVTCLLAALGGCGGGGGGGGSGATAAAPTPVTTAQGAYNGTFSNGGEHDTLVLENDQFYSIYGSTVGDAFAVYGFLQGNGKSSGGSFSATDVKDATTAGQLLSGTVSASYTAGASLNGSLTEGANVVTFTGTAIPASVYNYNTPASLGDLAGSWNLTSLRGFSNVFTIAATGAFTATSGGCSFSGSFTPRASGKNVFDVAMTFGASPCVLAGQSIGGIAIDFPLSSGKRQLIIVGLDQARTSSAAFFGTR